ncbi:YaaA family protein [Prevotella pallens]|uniref:YaaA family protein n=1 Tax=Prevotella pallens TaxID=60133 RepID=UPI001CB2F94E|nr:YaaA family protein [Prevotella pallens]MBF1495770.1 YaaA family protein [Prevotella pallens]
MQIILSSAKLMKAVTKMEQNKYTVPLFQNKAESFALELAQHSIEELKQELKCSTSLAQMAKQNFIDFFNQENKLPAILAYNGQAYKCLKAHTLTNSDMEFANKHLWILSFLYGMLRPHNLIHPYRLEGKIVLNASNDRSVFDYWKPLLTDVLIKSVKADDGILLHLATEEYQHIFDWKKVLNEVSVVQPLFKVFNGTKLKNITVYAKSCRGAMTRYVLQNKITAPKHLMGFEYEGFTFSSAASLLNKVPKGLTEVLWQLSEEV